MKKIVFVMSVVLVTGCASMPYEPQAREVKKKPRQGGVIALNTIHRPEDRARADFLMSANCGTEATVNVAEEGEVVVGEKTNSNSSKVNDTQTDPGFRIGGISFGSGSTRPSENTNTATETVHLKEWQISYDCVAMADHTGRGKKAISRK